MSEYNFSTSSHTWKQQRKTTNMGMRYWKLQKARWGGLGESDSPLGPRRDLIEFTPNRKDPCHTAFLPYNWWVVCTSRQRPPDVVS